MNDTNNTDTLGCGDSGRSDRVDTPQAMNDANTNNQAPLRATRRGRPRSLAAADEATVLDLHARGVPNTKIAAKVGVDPKTIGRFLQARGYPKRPKLDRVAFAREYGDKGETLKRMADRYDISTTATGRIVRAVNGASAKRGCPGEGDPRRGRGKERPWQGEDYIKSARCRQGIPEAVALARAGQRTWGTWPADETARAHAKALLTQSKDALDRAVRVSPERLAYEIDRARDVNPWSVEDALVEMLDERRSGATAKEVRA